MAKKTNVIKMIKDQEKAEKASVTSIEKKPSKSQVDGAAKYIKELTGKDMPVIQEKIEDNKRKLCIVGTAGSAGKAPYNDPNAEMWGVAHSLMLQSVKRLDKVFEIHLPYIYNQEVSPYSRKPIIHHANKENSPAWMPQKDIEAVTWVKDDNLNNNTVFPREYLKNKYKDLLPVNDKFYVTNSIAYMIVWALDMVIENDAYDELHMYGIHLETDTEWQYERPCNEWWLGVLAGYLLAKGKRGVIHLPEESEVLRNEHEYGIADIEVKRKKIQGKVDFFNRGIEDMKFKRGILVNEAGKLNNEMRMTVDQKINNLKQQYEALTKELKKAESMPIEQYDILTKQTISKKLEAFNNDIKNLDARLNAFQGARDAHTYHLKALNA